jgi:hypothetical protein
MLTYAGVCWRMLIWQRTLIRRDMAAHGLTRWRMLAYADMADVCWRVLAYADMARYGSALSHALLQLIACVCWRMLIWLTYAGVC